MEYFYSHSDNPQQFLQKTFQEGKNRRISFTKICVSILHTISNCGYSTDIKTFELLQKRLSPSQMSMIIDQPTGSKKYTALQRAAYKGNSNMVMLLLLAGANPNYVNSHGENLLANIINGEQDCVLKSSSKDLANGGRDFICDRYQSCRRMIENRQRWLANEEIRKQTIPPPKWVSPSMRKREAINTISNWWSDHSNHKD